MQNSKDTEKTRQRGRLLHLKKVTKAPPGNFESNKEIERYTSSFERINYDADKLRLFKESH